MGIIFMMGKFCETVGMHSFIWTNIGKNTTIRQVYHGEHYITYLGICINRVLNWQQY